MCDVRSPGPFVRSPVTTDDRTTEPSNGHPAADHAPAPHYEIRVKGHLGSRWAAWFDGLSLTNEDDGTTVIRGPVVDQAALHGLLQKLATSASPWSRSSRSPRHAAIEHRRRPPTKPITSTRSTHHDHRHRPHQAATAAALAVDDLTFDVAAGRVTGFVGPNGAGKSTTMRMMVGLTRPDHGDVRYDGVRYARPSPPGPRRRRRARRPLHASGPHRPQPPARRRRAQPHRSGRRVDEVLHEVGLECAADQRAGGLLPRHAPAPRPRRRPARRTRRPAAHVA